MVVQLHSLCGENAGPAAQESGEHPSLVVWPEVPAPFSLQDANFRGYDCLLLKDCAATTSPDYCMAATLYNVQQCFGFVVGSDEVVAALASEETRRE